MKLYEKEVFEHCDVSLASIKVEKADKSKLLSE
jgi:hypothetical protein